MIKFFYTYFKFCYTATMSEENKKRGRPRADNPMVRMPEMMVKPEQLSAYKEAAKKSKLSFSAWVREWLDKGTKAGKDE